MSESLAALVSALRSAPGLAMKREIQQIAQAFPRTGHSPWLRECAGGVRNGDDAAAIEDGDGHLLLASEGMLPELIRADPWFAGYCSILVNASDIAAMGGRPLAVVDSLFAGDAAEVQPLLRGMRAASEALGIPVVGGHTTRMTGPSPGTLLAVAILGRARRLITSYGARPGHELLFAVDLRGAYHGRGDNFDAATSAPGPRLRAQLAILPELSERGLIAAGKDVSMAGLPGTLTMLAEASGCGAYLALDALPRPPGTELARWLVTFPSYGFLLAVEPRGAPEVIARFARAELACARVGGFRSERRVTLRQRAAEATYWDLGREPLTGFSSPPDARDRGAKVV